MDNTEYQDCIKPHGVRGWRRAFGRHSIRERQVLGTAVDSKDRQKKHFIDSAEQSRV